MARILLNTVLCCFFIGFSLASIVPQEINPAEEDWTVIQRRGSPLPTGEQRQRFDLLWDDYAKGFGDSNKDFWLGLNAISALTNSADYILSIEMRDFIGRVTFAHYNSFRVAGASDNYRLTIDKFTGNTTDGDGMAYHNGMEFTTIDRDNDKWESANCAHTYFGGWWYNACFFSHLNGIHYSSSVVDERGIFWLPSSFEVTLEFVEMKIRPMGI